MSFSSSNLYFKQYDFEFNINIQLSLTNSSRFDSYINISYFDLSIEQMTTTFNEF